MKIQEIAKRMGVIKFSFHVFVTFCVVVLTWCFLLYPALICLCVIFDPSFRKPQINNYTLNMFYKTSQRYDTWAQYYLKSQYAKKANYEESVAATEWPMFGSVFYLLTAEEIKKELDHQKDGKSDKIRRVLLQSSNSAAKLIADPTTATWVKVMWGKNYLTKENLFYRMLLIMGLSSYENISGKNTYRAILTEQANSLADELSKAKHHVLDDYPGACYPNDVLWSVAAILRTDSILSTDHRQLAQQVVQALNTTFMTNQGLPGFMVDPMYGKTMELPRGCGNSGILIFAPELDRTVANQWYGNYEKLYWQDNGLCRGFREFSKTLNYSYNDVDSGPVIKGFGSVATFFGIGAARAQGRLDHALPITQEMIVVCWPTPFGLLFPRLMGKLMVDSSCLGETALLFSMSRPVPDSGIVPYTQKTPFIIWTAFFIYLIPALILLYLEYRSWKKWMKKFEK